MFFSHSLLLLGFCAASALSSSLAHHHQYQHLHLHLKRQNATFPVTQNASTTDPVVAAAESILAEAVIQQGVYNTWRVENPMRNTYRSRHSPQASTTRRRRSEEPAAPHLNSTIVAAAAVVAHRDALAQAANGTLNPPTPPPPSSFSGADDGAPSGNLTKRAGSDYWVPDVTRNGLPVMGAPAGFLTYRDVTNPQFAGGAKGDGVHDDTAAINAAIAASNTCGANCLSSSVKGILVYFPPGTYLISSPINATYYSQLVGDANNPPTIKTSASFIGLGAIQTDVYIPGGASAEWYIEQSNFYRQLRNFIIDIRATTTAKAAGLHWQVAQATSLLNVQIFASKDSASTQMGMFTENGSSGFMSDVFFSGGQYGLFGGNQQYTVRSFHFDGQHTAAICLIWDWGWTWSDLYITNTPTGILIINPAAPTGQQAGSTYIMDSVFVNVFYAVQATAMKKTILESSVIALDNCVFGNVLDMVHFDDNTNVPVPASGVVDFINFGNVQAFGGVTLPGFPTGNTLNIRHPYTPLINPSDSSRSNAPNPIRPRYFRKSRPQYETLAASAMLNVKSYGAKGDGVTDDTQAIRNAFKDANYNNVVYFPAGSYIITSTIDVPKVCRITGRIWSQLVARGSAFSQVGSPTPMLRVGQPGDVGTVEISDILFTSIGPLQGLVMVEWNIAEEAQGSVGIWDSHFRVGGAKGTNLGLADCPISTLLTLTPKCWAASMMLHITPNATGYFENMWAWVADHDLDDPTNTQISIGVGRGILVESQGPVWMYGTASEHSIMYQYNFYGASNVFAGMIQTESPYYQGGAYGMSPGIWGDAPMPGDPEFGHDSCDPTFGPLKCDFSWAVITQATTNLTIAGAGLYSWFDNYDQSVCVDKQNCQQRIFLDTGDNEAMVVTNLVTIGSVEMITNSATNETVYAANNTQAIAHPFWSMLALYFEDASPWDQDCDDNPDQSGCDYAPLCDYSVVYNDLDAVSAALTASAFDPSCVDYYALGALQKMLLGSLNNYTSVADGYDDVFGYYTEYVKDLVDPAMQDFLNVTTAPGNQYFTCTHDDGHGTVTTTGCPNFGPAGDKGWNHIVTTYNLINSTGFYDAIAAQYGLTKDEIVFGKSPEGNQVATCTSANGKSIPGCLPYTMETDGWPIAQNPFPITNPKDVVASLIPNVTNIANLLFARQLDMVMGNFAGDPDDMVQLFSMPVFMFVQGVESMAEAKQQGNQQKAEDKANLINKVLTIVFAVLSMIPGAGEGGLAGLATAGRLAGTLGNAGLGFYNIAADPSSAPMELISMFGGGGWKDAEDLATRAASRRALPAQDITNLGKTFKSLDDALQALSNRACKL